MTTTPPYVTAPSAIRPTLAVHAGPPCRARDPKDTDPSLPYVCTRDRGHTGEHVAYLDDTEVAHRWSA